MQSIADELRTAGLTVVEGPAGIGRTDMVPGIETRLTETGEGHQGADDINNLVTPARGVAYVERTGRVWLLADGPVAPAAPALVFVAAYREGNVTEAQNDALAVLDAVLGARYGIPAPDAGDGEGGPDPADSDGGDD